ncbi:hypothetical protein ACFE04_003399 [Oxalis oulophora]
MALNSQSGRAGSIQYEDFQPTSELKEEANAHILLVNLPGFQKEQIKVSYVHATRTINVHVEQRLTSGKWKRCFETFPVPQNCKVFEIRGKFQNGILTITMPKEIVTQVLVPEPAKIISPKAKLEEMNNSPPKAANVPSIDQNQMEKPKEEMKLRKTETHPLQEIDSPRKASSSFPDKKPEALNIPKEENKSQSQTFPENSSPKVSSSFPRKSDDFAKLPREDKVTSPSSKVTSLASKIKDFERQAEKSTPENQKKVEEEKPRYEEKDPKSVTETESSKKSSIAQMENEKEDRRVDEKKNLVGDVKKAVQEFAMEMNEERKAMVNMGVAVLVIAALGAYIAYSFGSSSGKTKE